MRSLQQLAGKDSTSAPFISQPALEQAICQGSNIVTHSASDPFGEIRSPTDVRNLHVVLAQTCNFRSYSPGAVTRSPV